MVRLAIESVKAGTALCVPGNHDVKFMRAAWGKNVQIKHGLAESLEQFARYEESSRGFMRVAAEFIDKARRALRARWRAAGRGARGG